MMVTPVLTKEIAKALSQCWGAGFAFAIGAAIGNWLVDEALAALGIKGGGPKTEPPVQDQKPA